MKSLIVLLALLLPALLVNLGERPIYKIQEIRIAETAREMLESRDWVVPRYNGDIRLQKPPLPYWMTAASFGVAGVNEFAARLPAVIFCLMSSLLLWLWTRRELGIQCAANIVLVFVISYIGLRYFRSGEADALLLYFICAACGLGYDLLRGRTGRGHKLLFGFVLGLGFLSKGPAALAIPLLTLAIFAISEKRAGRMSPAFGQLFSVPGLLALGVAAFAWYGWILWQLPEVAREFFTRQVDDTFISGTHAKPVGWYLIHWFEFYAPWGILLVPAGLSFYRQRGQAHNPILRFAWIWLGTVFVLLTLTVNKQMQYALLFAPAAAIITGHYLAEAAGKFAKANVFLFWLFCIALGVGVVIELRNAPEISRMLPWLIIPALPLLARHLLAENRVSAPVLLVAGLAVMAYLYGDKYLAKEPRKVAAQTLMAQASARQPLYQLRTALNDGSLSFYAGRVVHPVTPEEIARLLANHPALWLVSEKAPNLPGLSIDLEMAVDDLKLYRVEKYAVSVSPRTPPVPAAPG